MYKSPSLVSPLSFGTDGLTRGGQRGAWRGETVTGNWRGIGSPGPGIETWTLNLSFSAAVFHNSVGNGGNNKLSVTLVLFIIRSFPSVVILAHYLLFFPGPCWIHDPGGNGANELYILTYKHSYSQFLTFILVFLFIL